MNNKIPDKTGRLMKSINLITLSGKNKSFYIPVKIYGNVFDAAFLYSGGNIVNNDKTRRRPNAYLLADAAKGELLIYKNSYIEDFMDSEKYPLTTTVDYSVPTAKTAREQGDMVKKLNETYPLIHDIAFKEELSEDEKSALKDYQTLFKNAVPEGLMPYYEALSPDFFKWVEANI